MCAELLAKLPFGSHPKDFGVLGVHIRVEWGNKVLLMHDNVMWVDAAIKLRNVLHVRPPSRLTSRASEDGTTVGSESTTSVLFGLS